MKSSSISQTELANCIRFLSIDAVQKAESGHPGMPMGMADVATVLFSDFLRFDPKSPKWPNRDRFVLSAGHGSMLMYSLLYLTGYKDITLQDIKNFRQLGSKTAGHPEFHELEGIETTTGPLGQGLANSVGMAISEKLLKDRVGKELIDHKIYCIAGDGCLMEGISQEAISLAGHLKLDNLVVLWDDNSISIDGDLSLTSSENMQKRFESCNWNYIAVDGHNHLEIHSALKKAQLSNSPTLIACKTVIGFGSPNKAGSEKAHGSPLGKEEVQKVRQNLNWKYPEFEIPEEYLSAWRQIGKNHRKIFKNWEEKLELSDDSVKNFLKIGKTKDFGEDFAKKLQQFKQKIFLEKPKQATRKSSNLVLEFLTKEIPYLIGGSADLTGSVLTKTSSTAPISADNFSGSYIHYGIREHAMAAIMNGIALSGTFVPYGGTFLVFSDYLKPAIRLSALMKQQVLYIFTHDSIGLGEDGPTHQPIEHLAMLRGIPDLYVFRPADAQETLGCFEQALKYKNGPSALALTRQDVEFLRTHYESKESFCSYGAYIISDTALEIEPDAIILASGSEVTLALEAKEKLHEKGLAVRVVSIPCFELFEKQPQSYKNKILGPKNILKVGVEAGITQGWNKYIGDDGVFIGMSTFGASGKAEDLFKYFKITSDNVVEQVLAEVKSRRKSAIGKYKDKDDFFDEVDLYKQKALEDIEDSRD